MRFALIGVALFALSGCSTMQYSKPDATRAQFERDSALCMNGNFPPHCMAALGWKAENSPFFINLTEMEQVPVSQ